MNKVTPGEQGRQPVQIQTQPGSEPPPAYSQAVGNQQGQQSMQVATSQLQVPGKHILTHKGHVLRNIKKCIFPPGNNFIETNTMVPS
jgi:hypothetical protein